MRSAEVNSAFLFAKYSNSNSTPIIYYCYTNSTGKTPQPPWQTTSIYCFPCTSQDTAAEALLRTQPTPPMQPQPCSVNAQMLTPHPTPPVRQHKNPTLSFPWNSRQSFQKNRPLPRIKASRACSTAHYSYKRPHSQARRFSY